MYQGWDIKEQQWRSIAIDTPGASEKMFSAVADRDVEKFSQGLDLRYHEPMYQRWYHTYRTALRMAVKQYDQQPTPLLYELIMNCIARAPHPDHRLLRDLPIDHLVVQTYLTTMSADTICHTMSELGRFDIVQYLEQRGMPVHFSDDHLEGQMLKRLPSYYPELPEHYIPNNTYGVMYTLRHGSVDGDEWQESMLPSPTIIAEAIRRGLVTSFRVEGKIPSSWYAREIYKASADDKRLVLEHLTADTHASYRQALEFPSDDKTFYEWMQTIKVSDILHPFNIIPEQQDRDIPYFAAGDLIILDGGKSVAKHIDDVAILIEYATKDYPEDILAAMPLLAGATHYQHLVHEIIKHYPEDRQLAILNKLYQ